MAKSLLLTRKGKMSTNAIQEIAMIIPLERFVYVDQGRWQVDNPIGKGAAIDLLLARGVQQHAVDDLFKTRSYLKVVSIENEPNAPSLFRDAEGLLRLNTWVEPRLKPAKGEWPRIAAIVSWLTGGDVKGAEWFFNWLAFKVQHPAAKPLTAVLFCTQPGPGKNTLSRVIREMLGMENTADLEHKALTSSYNYRWARSLFCFGDDLYERGNEKDTNERMKVLIASDRIEIEGKHINQREITNRLAWVLSSNRPAPLVVEKEDRRYTVFHNFDEITPEHRDLVKSCWDVSQPDGMDPLFVREIQALWYDLLQWEVDRREVSTPYANAARQRIIDSSKEPHEVFFEDVDLNGLDAFMEGVLMTGDVELQDRDRWDFGPEGVSTDAIYKTYRRYCDNAGAKPLPLNKFGGAVQKHRPIWPGPFQKRIPGTSQRVNVYEVPRSPEALEQFEKRAGERERKESARRKREMVVLQGDVG